MTAPDQTRTGWRSALRRVSVSPIALWVAFLIVHAWLWAVNLVGAAYPLGDVSLVYKFWTDQAVVAQYWVGIDAAWVYPILALVPMLVARLFGPEHYATTWLGMVILLDAIALAFLTGWGRSPRRIMAAWWWLGFLLLLGPIAVARIDSISVPLAIVAVLFVATRPQLAGVLLTIATWIKVWPAAILVALVIAAKARWRILWAAIGVSVSIVAIALALGSGANVFSFVTQQASRGLQVEAPVSTAWLWAAFGQVPGAHVYYDSAILTYQVAGGGVDVTAAVMTPLMALVALAIVLLAMLAVRTGAPATETLPPLVLALVTALIAVNKVGSPQFITWLAVPVILGLVTAASGQGRSFRFPAVLVLVIALLTQVIYPGFYDQLLALNPLMLAVLTARNLLLLVLLGWAIAALWRLGRGKRHAILQLSAAASPPHGT